MSDAQPMDDEERRMVSKYGDKHGAAAVLERVRAKRGTPWKKADQAAQAQEGGASVGLRAGLSFAKDDTQKAEWLKQRVGPENVSRDKDGNTIVREGGKWKQLDPGFDWRYLGIGAGLGDLAGDVADVASDIVAGGKEEVARSQVRGALPMFAHNPMVEAPAAAALQALQAGKGGGEIGAAALGGAKQGAVETAVGGVTAAVPALRRPAGKALARLDGNKLVGGLTKALRQVVDNGGSPGAQKALAGKLMNEALEESGSELLPAKRILERAAEHDFAVLIPEEKALLRDIGKTVTDGTMTLSDADKMIKLLGKKGAAVAEKDPDKARILLGARDALIDDIEAVGNEGLTAAVKLQQGRAAYGKAMRKQDQADFLLRAEDPTSVERNIDPGKLANMASGEKRADVKRMFKGDPDGLKRFEGLIDSARVYASKGKMPGGVLENVPVAQAAERKLRNILTAGNMIKVAKDPAAASMLRLAIDPKRTIGPEALTVLTGKIAARIGLEDEAEQQPAPAPSGPNLAGIHDRRTMP